MSFFKRYSFEPVKSKTIEVKGLRRLKTNWKNKAKKIKTLIKWWPIV